MGRGVGGGFHGVFQRVREQPGGTRHFGAKDMSNSNEVAGSLPLVPSRAALEALYRRYNRREFVHPDPLEFLYRYDSALDREVAGLVASALAYGRVRQILGSVTTVLERMGPSPSAFVLANTGRRFRSIFSGFRHRFTTGDDLSGLLAGSRAVLKRHGSLQACFMCGIRHEDPTILRALTLFVGELKRGSTDGCGTLLPSPADGSACKRLNLFLRWMVRNDAVDPGEWPSALRRKLVVPLDTHMHGIGLALGLTRRKQADMRTAVEITESFKIIAPEDPIRYDFALTRPGIRGGMDA